MNDTPRTQKHRLDCTEYDGHVPHSDGDWVCAEVAEELERDLNAAILAIKELLNDGVAVPHPYTGGPEQFRADVGGIVAWVEEVEAKSKACADSSNPTGQPPPRLGGGSVAPGCSHS